MGSRAGKPFARKPSHSHDGMLSLLALGASPSVYGTRLELGAGQQPWQSLS